MTVAVCTKKTQGTALIRFSRCLGPLCLYRGISLSEQFMYHKKYSFNVLKFLDFVAKRLYRFLGVMLSGLAPAWRLHTNLFQFG